MSKAKCNNIEIEYDTLGDPSGKPLLLIMGLGSQMIKWPPGFCELLVKKGFYVIRFDNRDVGLSTKFDDAGKPDVFEAYKKLKNYFLNLFSKKRTEMYIIMDIIHPSR